MTKTFNLKMKDITSLGNLNKLHRQNYFAVSVIYQELYPPYHLFLIKRKLTFSKIHDKFSYEEKIFLHDIINGGSNIDLINILVFKRSECEDVVPYNRLIFFPLNVLYYQIYLSNLLLKDKSLTKECLLYWTNYELFNSIVDKLDNFTPFTKIDTKKVHSENTMHLIKSDKNVKDRC